MNKRILKLAPALLLAASAAKADDTLTKYPDHSDRNFGVGMVFEGDAGLSLYGATSGGNFLQGGFAWGPAGAFVGTADYAFGYPAAIRGAPALTPYWGIGAIALHWNDYVWAPRDQVGDSRTDVGMRIPLGISAVIPRTPVQLGGEVAPTLLLTPASYSFLEGGVYARVLF